MQYMNDRPAGLRANADGIVEVKVWEAFLQHNRHNLYTTLSTYAIDNGPDLRKGNDMATVSFRFTEWDWNNTLKRLLYSHNVPVISESHLGVASLNRLS